MIGMYDEPVAVPIVDLLDSNMMQMYVNAAKGEYERAYNEQKEFAKEFGELYSPSDSLNKAYYDQTKGRINQGINYLYQNGIDPLRSAEGRAYIAKLMREIPYAKIANWKSDAENMKTYNKSAAALMAEGKYDKDYADYMLEQQGLKPMDQFDPYGDQRWTTLSPVEYKPLDALTKTYGDAIKPTLLTANDVTSLGEKYDPNNDYMGISYNQINSAADKAASALATSPQGRFEMQRIKSKMIEQGLNPTDADVQKVFAGKIAAGFGTKAGIQAMDANKYKYAKYQSDLQDELDRKKTSRDLQLYKDKLQADRDDQVMRYKLGLPASSSGWYTTIFDIAKRNPGQATSTDINKLRDNGVTLADPSGTWDETTQRQKQKDEKTGASQTESRKVQRITITDGDTVVKSGNFKAFQDKGKIVPKGLYKKPGHKIEAEVTSGPVYNKKLNKYYIKATVTAVNDNFQNGEVGKSIWVEVVPGYMGKASNKAN